MNSRSFPGRFSPLKAILSGTAVIAAMFVASPALHAQNTAAGQAEITTALHTLYPTHTPTINTATAAQLEAAVASAIVGGSVTPGDLAASALAPFGTPAKIRADRSTTGPAIVAAAIKALAAANDSNFITDAAAVTDEVAHVNFPTTTQVLTLAGQEAVVKSALGAISDAYVAGSPISQSNLLLADKAIGTSLAGDSDLTGLPNDALTAIIQVGVSGITGLKATSGAAAASAAASFEAGVVSGGTAPNGATLTVFDGQMELSATLAALYTSTRTPYAAPTINSATAAQLEAAVAKAIVGGSVAPGDLAASALEPSGGPAKVRADRNTSGPGIVAASITALAASNDSSFVTDSAAVTDEVAHVNYPTTTADLTLAGQEAVVKSALGAISDAYVKGAPASLVSSANLLLADQAIGTALAGDADLTGLPASGLTTILQTGIEGITGLKAMSTAAAPYAAENFVAGIVSGGTAPNSATLTAFAVSILKNVAANANVDEYVSFAIGSKENTSQSSLLTTGTTLLAKYTADQAKITQGLADAVTAAPGEAGRLTLVNGLANAQVKYATTILEGAVFADPYYAGEFSGAVLTDIYDSPTGHTLITTDAPGIASGVGAILGQDGNSLTQVSGTFSDLIISGALNVTNAATYANDLITGAAKSTLPATDFLNITAGSAGGKLAVGTGVINTLIAGSTVDDLVDIADLFGNAILTKFAAISSPTKAEATTVASEIGALAKDIAAFTKNESYDTVGSTNPEPVATIIAGSLAKLVASFDFPLIISGATDVSPQSLIFAAINTDVAAETTGTIKTDVGIVLNPSDSSNPLYYTNDTFYTGPINTDETPITNM